MFQSVSDQVFFYLKEKIINNELVPGSVLSIDRLSSEFGISNTPVREAVVRLESLDLVTVNRNRNITVSAMSREKILDILEMRRLLETYGSRTAALDITNSEIEVLETVLDSVLANPGDFEQYKRSDLELHDAVTRHIKNREIQASLKNLSVSSLRIRYYARYYGEVNPNLEDSVVKITAEHRTILDALKTHDPDRVEQAVESHLLNAEERPLAALNRMNPSS
jgi:DNA-binding GntR family transcriptional regulator